MNIFIMGPARTGKTTAARATSLRHEKCLHLDVGGWVRAAHPQQVKESSADYRSRLELIKNNPSPTDQQASVRFVKQKLNGVARDEIVLLDGVVNPFDLMQIATYEDLFIRIDAPATTEYEEKALAAIDCCLDLMSASLGYSVVLMTKPYNDLLEMVSFAMELAGVERSLHTREIILD